MSPSFCFKESALSSLCSSSGKRAVTDSLILSTAELSGARIALSDIHLESAAFTARSGKT